MEVFERTMVRHIVMYKLKEPTEANKKALVDMFKSMRGNIDELRGVEAGSDILGTDRSYDVVLVTTFDDLDDYYAYQDSEYHVNVVKKYVHSVVEKAVAVDYNF